MRIKRIFNALGRIINFGINVGPEYKLERRGTSMYAVKKIESVKERMAGSRPILFLVGRVNKQNKDRWEVLGLFGSEEGAKSHCTSWYDFYGPLELNEYMRETPRQWPGLRYPVAEKYYTEHPEEVPDECRERFEKLTGK